MSTQPVVAHKPAAEDFMPLHGIDHVELWVGNARQAAHFYTRAFGFQEVAYAGLETGLRWRIGMGTVLFGFAGSEVAGDDSRAVLSLRLGATHQF